MSAIHVGRKTIGVLLDYMTFFAGGYEEQLRVQLETHCRERGHNLLLIYGGALDERWGQRESGVVLDLMHSDRVDALIIVSTLLASHCGLEMLEDFVERYRPLPLCSVGTPLRGVPSVVVDNRSGMRALLDHMLGEHGYRRLAFISGAPGNPEASSRLDICRQALADYGVPWDARLEEGGHFLSFGGRTAMEGILDRCSDFEAVIAANDFMALGAIDVLRERGFRVPAERAITGFDDVRLARLGNPPLTTVEQPFNAIVRHALEIVLDQLAGRSVPALTELQTKLVIRRSCGCSARRSGSGPVVRAIDGVSPSEHLRRHGERIRAGLRDVLRTSWANEVSDAEELLNGLRREFGGYPGSFLETMDAMHEAAAEDIARVAALQIAVDWLRDEFRAFHDPEIDSIFYEAMSLIASANTTTQVSHQLRLEQDYLRVLASGEEFAVALDLAALRRVLHTSLPAAGFGTVFISRFPEGETSELETFVCLLDGHPQDLPGARFPARYLYPPGAFPPERRYTLAIFPLAYENRFAGVMAFEHTPGTFGYHATRDQISATLRTINLHEELVNQTMRHERKRLQSLSVLAGGVAHDLNNALGPVVALPDVILDELKQLGLAETDIADIRTDVETIKQATLRASQSIRDLLTLGRQGQTNRKPLDLNQVVQSCLDVGLRRSLTELNPDVVLEVEFSRSELPIRGSMAQLSRAVANLVRNAVEAVSGAGRVSVRLFEAHVAQPISGHDVVAPGHYAVLEVSDTGSGISETDLGQVFDPFFTRKEPRSHSGTGLGLAIVHGVVKEHDGFVNVTSIIGKGTTFTIHFPWTYDIVQPSSRPCAPQRGKAKVLIVDDDPVQLRTGRRVLGHLGYEVETLLSGKEAIHRFAQAAKSGEGKRPYDLLLLDMILNEDLDGLEVFEAVELLFPGQKAVIVSGHAPTDRIERAVLQGLGWLAKPYTTEGLIHAVKATLATTG